MRCAFVIDVALGVLCHTTLDVCARHARASRDRARTDTIEIAGRL